MNDIEKLGEVAHILSGYKIKVMDCEHKPLDHILKGEPSKYGFSIKCSDCGTWLCIAGLDTYNAIMQLYEEEDFK